MSPRLTAPPTAPSLTDDDLTRDERWILTSRIVASHHFAKAAQLRELLVYLSKRAIACPNEDVCEQEIGCRVLGRRPDYNPQADNIVRVQIRRLRQKLDEYFLSDGLQEPMVITIPKGSHILRFDQRPQEAAAEAPIVTPPPPVASSSRLQLWIPLILCVAIIAFLGGRATGAASAVPSADRALNSLNPLWNRLFQKDKPTSIVIADSSMVIVQNVLKKNLKLNDYIDRSYRDLIGGETDPALRDTLQMIAGRQYTSLADAALSGQLSSIGAGNGSKVTVRYARHMNIRDFNAGNFVLIGSSHGVPWVELFEPALNFQFDRTSAGRFGFRNKRPLKGESAVYESNAPLNAPQQSYAAISMVPNLAHNGSVLMLTGITMESTEAAGEFALSDDFPKVLSKAFGSGSMDSLPYFQIFLKATSMAGAPHKVDVIATRRLNP